MEKLKGFEAGPLSLSEDERKKAELDGTLEELERGLAAANERIANGESVEVVVQGIPAVLHLVEGRVVKGAEEEHGKMEDVAAFDLGAELSEDLGGDFAEPGDDEKTAA
ncbi:MAG: hypothetical protein LiPW15_837 [Parcubacteria group bacterium LiPW_15]|nr:MAG: hypothetical protein LiPW15_837 [Parcubacteria group bacterium LiPW_15]